MITVVLNRRKRQDSHWKVDDSHASSGQMLHVVMFPCSAEYLRFLLWYDVAFWYPFLLHVSQRVASYLKRVVEEKVIFSPHSYSLSSFSLPSEEKPFPSLHMCCRFVSFLLFFFAHFRWLSGRLWRCRRRPWARKSYQSNMRKLFCMEWEEKDRRM